ncbi:MAG: helix-turn-helix domain-containing protein [Planctomycetota bacterium]|jgi:two-component system response regulator HydG
MSLIGQPLSVWERTAIVCTLLCYGNDREQAAAILGIGERTLYRKLKQYKLQGIVNRINWPTG